MGLKEDWPVPTAHVRCPSCLRTTPLDESGRFVAHATPDAGSGASTGRVAGRWCPMSGLKPGRIVVDDREAEKARKDP